MKSSVLSRRGFAGWLGVVALSLTALAGIACGPPGLVVKQAMPNPFVGKNEFVVEPVTYPNLSVGGKPEATYLADKKPESQQSFEADKTETAKNLIETLMAEGARRGLRITPAAGAPGMFNIRPMVTFFEPGNFNGFVNIATELKATLQIVDAQGQVIDEVLFQTAVGASLANPSSGGRMHTAGKNLGSLIASYLQYRVALSK